MWGLNFPLMKLATDSVPVGEVVGLRLLSGALLVALIATWRHVDWPKSRGTWAHIAVLALLSNVVVFTLYAWGTEHAGASIAGTLAGVGPLVTAALARPMLGERLTKSQWLGIGFGLAGVVLATEPWRGGLLAGELGGAGAVFAGSVVYGVSFAYARRFVSGRAAPLAVAASQLAIAAVMSIALLPFFGGLGPIDPETGLILILLGPIGTGLAYVLFHSLVRDLGAARAATVSYLPPVVAVIAGVGGLGEVLRPALVAGVGAVLVGLVLAGRRTSRPDFNAKASVQTDNDSR